MQYKDYEIEPFESSPKRWRARVQRIDGRMIRIFTPSKEVESITSSGMESFSADDAAKVAMVAE